jgi:cysteine desulfurase family protein (TIGR01976 family)
MNGAGLGTTIIGPSTTDLIYRLANAMTFRPGDEVVISVANHESNIGPWARLEKLGVTVKWWGPDPDTCSQDFESLGALLTDKTRIVAVPHTSNLLGDILDVKKVADMAHSVGALVVIDGVANAPHSAVDVAASGADFYVLSMYKVFGPHLALLFGTDEAWEEVEGPNHFFFERSMPYMFELGCQPYESLAGLLGSADYLAWLGGGGHDRATIVRAYAEIERLEGPTKDVLAEGLARLDSVRLIGPSKERHPTFSFVHDSLPSNEVVRRVNGPEVGIRYGHMYAHRLCDSLGVPTETGVVRVSAVHYNTPKEAEMLLLKLEEALAGANISA